MAGHHAATPRQGRVRAFPAPPRAARGARGLCGPPPAARHGGLPGHGGRLSCQGPGRLRLLLGRLSASLSMQDLGTGQAPRARAWTVGRRSMQGLYTCGVSMQDLETGVGAPCKDLRLGSGARGMCLPWCRSHASDQQMACASCWSISTAWMLPRLPHAAGSQRRYLHPSNMVQGRPRPPWERGPTPLSEARLPAVPAGQGLPFQLGCIPTSKH